jgi:ABC-2 type transport system ATP-binding protein
MKVICGALDPNSGEILVDRKQPQKAKGSPSLLGWLPERAPLNPSLTVREHLEITGRLRGLEVKQISEELERVSQALNLAKYLSQLAHTLSLGTRRRAALAVTLIGRPRLIILDEPTSSLDPDEVRRLKSLLTELKKETTLILSSHILSEVAELTDQAIIMNQGRILGSFPWSTHSPDEVYFKILSGSGS